jgi:hypothetical protein
MRRVAALGALGAGDGLSERANYECDGVPSTCRYHREDAGDEKVDQPLAPVGILTGGPRSQRAEPTVYRQGDNEGRRNEQDRRL